MYVCCVLDYYVERIFACVNFDAVEVATDLVDGDTALCVLLFLWCWSLLGGK